MPSLHRVFKKASRDSQLNLFYLFIYLRRYLKSPTGHYMLVHVPSYAFEERVHERRVAVTKGRRLKSASSYWEGETMTADEMNLRLPLENTLSHVRDDMSRKKGRQILPAKIGINVTQGNVQKEIRIKWKFYFRREAIHTAEKRMVLWT